MSQHLRGHEQEQASVVSQQSYRTAQESQLSSDNECTPRASVLNPPEMTDGPERLTFAFYHPPQASIANPPETLDGPESLTFAPHNPPRPFAVGEVSRFSEYISDESNEPKPTRYIRYSGSTGHTLMVNGNGTGNARNSRNIDPEKAKRNIIWETRQRRRNPLPLHDMVAISLGILALPSVLATVGLILILGMGAMAWYSGLAMHEFRTAYPSIYSWADACGILLQPLGFPNVGREIAGGAQILFLLFLVASHILTWIICLDTLTGHATCNIVWGVVGVGIFWRLDVPRTCRGMSWMSIVCEFFLFFVAYFRKM